MKGYYLFPTIIILIFIAMSLSTSVSYSPYTKNSMYKNYHPYEGFSSKIGYAKTDVPAAKAAAVPSAAAQNIPEYNNKKKTGCKKLFGFEGLYCDPRDEGEKLDYFSNAKGELDCQGSGLTNSQGSLCFDKTMTTLLSTRGGNAKGGDAQIGF